MRSKTTDQPITQFQADEITRTLMQAALAGFAPSEITRLRKKLVSETKAVNAELTGQGSNAGS